MKENNFENKNIVLIGGAGFIGHNLAIHLKNKGAKVSILDSLEVNNLNSVIGNSDNLPFPELAFSIIQSRLALLRKENIKIFVQDARDYHKLSDFLNTIKPNVIIQLCAVSHANKSNKDPHSTFDHSFRTLENALDNAKKRVEHFIYFSSSMVYGNFETKGLKEDALCKPIGIYGALKLSGEHIIKAYNQVFDLPYTIIRPSALYGERCISRRVGQIFIENAIHNKDIDIYGDDNESLDFTYIQDLIIGVENILKYESSKNETFNITFGSERKIMDMAKIVQKNFPKITINTKKRDKLMPIRGTLSVDKAKKLINYNPKWSLEKGYPEYINWYKNFIK